MTAKNSAIVHGLEVKYSILLSTQYLFYISQTFRRHFRYHFEKIKPRRLKNHVLPKCILKNTGPLGYSMGKNL